MIRLFVLAYRECIGGIDRMRLWVASHTENSGVGTTLVFLVAPARAFPKLSIAQPKTEFVPSEDGHYSFPLGFITILSHVLPNGTPSI